MTTKVIFNQDRTKDGSLLTINNILEEYSSFSNSEEDTLELSDNIVRILKNKKVAIYGAGTSGGFIFDVSSSYNSIPVIFIDKNADVIKEYKGIKVHLPDIIKTLNVDEWVVIVANNRAVTALEIIKSIKELSTGISVLDGRYLIRILNFPGCVQKSKNAEIFDLLRCIQCGVDNKKCPLFTEFLKRESKYEFVKKSGSSKFDWCGYILGQICTLKCECCCEGVPFLKNGTFAKTEDVISDIEKISGACEYLERLEFIGGEPLLHPGLKNIVEAALSMNKIGYIYIFTNGTVVPKDDSIFQIFKHPRVLLNISNYKNQWPEKLINNVNVFEKKLADNDVKYMILDSPSWLDISGFEENDLSDAKLEVEFSRCFINYCHRLHNGILYRCPHQYAGVQQHKLELIKGQFINIHALSQESLANELERFEEIKFTDACRHCSMPVGPKHVLAGKQLDIKNR